MQLAANGAGRKPNGKGNDKGDRARTLTKFVFKGCWECEIEGHSRHECPQWKRMLGYDGRPPAGHKGAKDKALETWKAERTAARPDPRAATGAEAAGATDDVVDGVRASRAAAANRRSSSRPRRAQAQRRARSEEADQRLAERRL